jgi:hypothetical protein
MGSAGERGHGEDSRPDVDHATRRGACAGVVATPLSVRRLSCVGSRLADCIQSDLAGCDGSFQVSHILNELVKLLHERNGWKAALKQSQVEMLSMEKKYVAQMRHRLVCFLSIPTRSHSQPISYI